MTDSIGNTLKPGDTLISSETKNPNKWEIRYLGGIEFERRFPIIELDSTFHTFFNMTESNITTSKWILFNK